MPHFIHFPWSWDMLSVRIKSWTFILILCHTHVQYRGCDERERESQMKNIIHVRTFQHLNVANSPCEWAWDVLTAHKAKGVSWIYTLQVNVVVGWMNGMECWQKVAFYRHWIVVLTIFPSCTIFCVVEDESSDVHRCCVTQNNNNHYNCN